MLKGMFASGMVQGALDAASGPTLDNRPERVAELRSQQDALRRDVAKLYMITEALWTILKDRHGYADEDLARMIEDIDMRDGLRDGKVARQPNPLCPGCGRTLIGKHPVCLYCGAEVVRDVFER